jgi:hypothetical protein
LSASSTELKWPTRPITPTAKTGGFHHVEIGFLPKFVYGARVNVQRRKETREVKIREKEKRNVSD